MTSTTFDDKTHARRLALPLTGSILFALVAFTTGFAGFDCELILSTVSTYLLGNSIEQFSVVIALMMLAMGAGGWLQRVLFKREERLIESFMRIELVLGLVGGFAPIAIFGAFGSLPDHFDLVLYAFATSIGLF